VVLPEVLRCGCESPLQNPHPEGSWEKWILTTIVTTVWGGSLVVLAARKNLRDVFKILLFLGKIQYFSGDFFISSQTQKSKGGIGNL
jgi:hypothetical protein